VRRLRRLIVPFLLACVIPAIFARGATPAAPATPPIDPNADQPIHRDEPAASGDGTKTTGGGLTSNGAVDVQRVVLALAGVVGVILLLRWGAKRFFPAAVAHRSTRTLKVISRVTISPKQHLLLLQIGKRLLVVGDTGGQLNPLCQIKDPEEVSSMLAQIHEESANTTSPFNLFFGRARKSFSDEQPAMESTPSDDKPQTEIDADAERPFDSTHEVNDLGVNETRKELSSLSEKVRDLKRQLGA
jgi:flagellar biogenesis protein FliO